MTLIITRAAFLLAVTALSAAAGATPAERALRALLAASESDEAAARFVDEQFDPGHLRQVPASAIAGQIRALGRQSGGLTIDQLKPNGEHEILAQLSAVKVKAQVRMRLAVAPDPPHRIRAWGMQPTAGAYVGELLAGISGPESERLARIRTAIEQAAGAHRFSGVVLIARGKQVLLETAVGQATLDPPAPNTPATKFHLGSMPKMFTATAVLQLVQQGKVKLDEPIATYLPDYPNPEHARKVTLHHLLTHTSGLGNYFSPEFDKKKGSIRKLEDYYQFFAGQPLRFEPGARWEYSNAGLHVAGIIVERVSGLSYYDYVRKHIFEPAGMAATGNNRVDEHVPGLATGYTRFNTEDVLQIEPPRKSNIDTLPPKGGPAGGGYSTLGDLHRFAQALTGHRLLDSRHTALLTEGKVAVPMAPDARYAYGFEEMPIAGQRTIGHSGGAPGMNAILRIVPETGLTVAVLSNFDPPAAQLMGQKIVEIMARP